MPIQPITFRPISFGEASPFLRGYNNQNQAYEQLRASQLANAIKQQYGMPQAAADLAYKQAQTPYIQSETAGNNKNLEWTDRLNQNTLQNSASTRGYQGSETAKNNYQVAHPSSMYSGDAQLINLLKEMQGSQGNSGVQGGAPQNPMASLPNQPGSQSNNSINLLQNYLNDKFKTSEQKAEQKLAIDRQGKDITNFDNLIAKARQDAADSTSLSEHAQRFGEAYKNSKYKGSGLFGGSFPSSGPLTALQPFSNFGEETKADSEAANMQAIQTKLLAAGRGSVALLKVAGLSKLSRNMTPQTVKDITGALNAAHQRNLERVDFLNRAKSVTDPQTAEVLWDKYVQQRPATEGYKVNKDFENSWEDYLNPKSVEQAKSDARFEVITDKDIEHTAKIHNTTPEKVKDELRKNGRIKYYA